MSSIVAERPRVALRPLALPSEHGGWGFLLEPIALGMLVAPSAGGLLIAAGALVIFLMRHPLKLAAQDWRRGRRYPRTRACQLLVLAYSGAACAFFAAAPPKSLLALAAAIPFALTQFVFDVRNEGRGLLAEIFGAVAPGAIATSIALAAGRPVAFAATLWLLMALRAVPSILYVRSALRENVGRASARPDRLKPVPHESRMLMLAAHAIAVVIAAFIALPAAVAMLLLLLRALPKASDLAARTIGIRELAWGAASVVLIAIAYVTA